MKTTYPTAYGDFEWDSEKEAANRRKHGISFVDAVVVFKDEQRFLVYDSAHSEDEDRYILLGRLRDFILWSLFIQSETVITESFQHDWLQRARSEHMNGNSTKTDWARLDAMTEEEIYANALADPDNPPLMEEQLANGVRLKDIPDDTLLEKFRNAQKRENKQTITARFDADVVRYYKAKGKGYQSIMNAALRSVMEAEQHAHRQS